MIYFGGLLPQKKAMHPEVDMHGLKKQLK